MAIRASAGSLELLRSCRGAMVDAQSVLKAPAGALLLLAYGDVWGYAVEVAAVNVTHAPHGLDVFRSELQSALEICDWMPELRLYNKYRPLTSVADRALRGSCSM